MWDKSLTITANSSRDKIPGEFEQDILQPVNLRTQADRLASEEAAEYLRGWAPYGQNRVNPRKREHDGINAEEILESPEEFAERPGVARIGKFVGNPPVNGGQLLGEPKRRKIQPSPVILLSPLGERQQYRPLEEVRGHRGEFLHGYPRINRTFEIEQGEGVNRRLPLIREPIVEVVGSETDDSEFESLDDPDEYLEIALNRRQTPEPEPFGEDQVQLELIEEPREEPNMAQANIADIIQALQGNVPQDRHDAMTQLAQYVQHQNQEEAVEPPAARMTLREALRDGAADNLKVTDLLPETWGGIKDGEPDSHCLRFENYATVQGYDNDRNKIAWFQATLKGDALTWYSAANFETWEELKQAFISEFENQPSRNVAVANFRGVTWNGTERANLYLKRLKKAARVIAATDDDIMLQFELGLPKSVKLFFGATRPGTIKAMTDTLQQYLDLHGPVAVHAPGAVSALNTMAQVLADGGADPFVENPFFNNPFTPMGTPRTGLERIMQEDARRVQHVIGVANAMRRMGEDKTLNSMTQNMSLKDPTPSSPIIRPSREERKVSFKDTSDGEETRKERPSRDRHAPRERSSSAESGMSGRSESPSPHRKMQGSKYRDNYKEQNSKSQGWQDGMIKRMESLMAPVMQALDEAAQGNRMVACGGVFKRGEQSSGNGGTPYEGQGDNYGRGPYRRWRAPPGDGCCFNCGTYGHYANECPRGQEPRRQNQYNSRGYPSQSYGGGQQQMIMPAAGRGGQNRPPSPNTKMGNHF